MNGPTIPVVVGDTVLFNGQVSNGVGEHPAVVTRVWSPTMVNLQVLPDCGAPYWQGSVSYDEYPVAGKLSWRGKQAF